MKKLKIQNGQALIIMIFVSLIGMTIISAAAIFILQNMKSTSLVEQGTVSYYAAESGAEEALLRLIRDPNYLGTSPGQPLTFTVDNYQASVDITVSTPGGTIISIGTYNNSHRKIQVETVYNNYVRSITSWKEIY